MTCSNQLDNLISDLNNLSINSGLITLSQKDRPMLSLGGYFYRISHQSDKKISWRCTEQHCKAKCSTEACEIGKEYFVTFKNENDRVHIHGQKNSLLDIKIEIHDCLPRTNNYVEAWHNAFSSMLCKHPLVYALIDAFKNEQKKTEDTLVHLQTGITYKRPPAYIILDKRIQEIMKDYSSINFEQFYDNFSYILEY